jgi:hypothetical protein
VRREIAVTFLSNFTEKNISYFVGLDVTEHLPSTILTGDHSITNGALLPNRILELGTNSAVGWTRKLHDRHGNIGLSDGSVQSVGTSKLRDHLASTGLATNRLAMPVE